MRFIQAGLWACGLWADGGNRLSRSPGQLQLRAASQPPRGACLEPALVSLPSAHSTHPAPELTLRNTLVVVVDGATGPNSRVRMHTPVRGVSVS